MESRHTMSVLFYTKKSRLLKNGDAPIYMRVTINSKRAEISTQFSIHPTKWSVDAGMAKQDTKQSRDVNKFLDTLKIKMFEKYKQLIEERKEISAQSLKNAFLGIKTNEKTLVSVFDIHNEDMKKLIGIEYSPLSLNRYNTCLKQLVAYMSKRYKVCDMEINEIDHEFITNFELFLRTEKKVSHNTAMRYMKGFKKIIRLGLASNIFSTTSLCIPALGGSVIITSGEPFCLKIILRFFACS